MQTVVFDKTGTITTGEPVVTDVVPANGLEADQLLELAVTIEQRSEHPLARAICAHVPDADALAAEHDLFEFKQVPGEGVLCDIDGDECLAGNERMMHNHGIELGDAAEQAARLAEKGATPLFFAAGGMFAGIIALSDVPKPSSARALAELKAMGISTVMLTGDNRRTAEAVRDQVGADDVIADVLPADKEQKVRELSEHGTVAMVGDGINDAPALARADVGIAVGAGTDVAIESADAVLIRNDLEDVPAMIQRNAKQTLFWALFDKAVSIPDAAGVFSHLGVNLNPMIAAAAMSCSSVFVVSNALRLRSWKPDFVTRRG